MNALLYMLLHLIKVSWGLMLFMGIVLHAAINEWRNDQARKKHRGSELNTPGHLRKQQGAMHT